MADDRLQEHFWFTATKVGLNGFLFAHEGAVSALTTVVVSTMVSAFAVYLGIERSLGDDRRRFLAQLRFVVNEFSGALFYLLLIVIS